MSRQATDPSREQPPLAIQEATASKPLSVDAEGNVLIHMIRPCVGRGRGRHVYEAKMLEANAHKFTGWKMFMDHELPEARKANGGLPRKITDMGGRVLEAFWDGNVPASGRFGQGAVVGRVRPTPPIRSLVENDPELLEVSINATATGVKPVMREGKRAWLVEGIEDRGTVDWVSEGGAGGKVVCESLLEAVYGTTDEEEAALLDTLTDDELAEHLAATRPGVLEAAASKAKPKGKAEDDTEDDGDDSDVEAMTAKYVKRGLSPELAKKAAQRACAAKKSQEADSSGADNKGDDVPLTDEQKQEVSGLVEAAVEAAVTKAIEEGVSGAVEKTLGEALTRVRAESRVDADRLIEVRDLRDRAHEMIQEADLPAAFAAQSIARFNLVDGEPTDALDVYETVEDDKVTATALDVLEAAVEAEIEAQRKLVASVAPTRVRGQGPKRSVQEAATTATEGEGKKKDGQDESKPDRVGGLTRALLQESQFSDPDKVYAGVAR